jgi:hypothetical protein
MRANGRNHRELLRPLVKRLKTESRQKIKEPICSYPMLEHEWQELEILTQRIAALRARYHDARQSRHVGLMAGLQQELARAQRMRELVLQHLAVGMGSRP